MNVCVIIPAAGSGQRYHTPDNPAIDGRSKLDEDLGGRPVLQRTVELFTKHPDVSSIIVAGPHDPDAFAAFRQRHADKLGLLGVKLVQGGKVHRYETVQAALAHVPDGVTHVAVHDAARPCTSDALIERVFAAAEAGHKAVIPGVDVADTLKRVGDEVAAGKPDPLAAILGGDSGSSGKPLGRRVVETVDRRALVGVQTPQVFEIGLLKKAYAQKDLTSTDDSQLIERLGDEDGEGGGVLVVPGEAGNIKITRHGDILLARAILGVKPPAQRETHKRF